MFESAIGAEVNIEVPGAQNPASFGYSIEPIPGKEMLSQTPPQNPRIVQGSSELGNFAREQKQLQTNPD